MVAYAAETQRNSTHEDDQDDTVQYEPHVNFNTTWNHDENSTRNDESSVRHEFYSNYTKSLHEEDNHNAPVQLRDNFTKSDDGDNFTTSHELSLGRNDSIDKDLKDKCNSTTCIPICCELGYSIIQDVCHADNGNYSFPEVEGIGKRVDEVFPLIVSDPCKIGRFILNPIKYPQDEYMVLINGSIHLLQSDLVFDTNGYCFTVMNSSIYEVTICFQDSSESNVKKELEFVGVPIGIIVSLPFLLLTFVVYTILPELRNMHGYTLRGYVGSLFVAYVSIVPFQLLSPNDVPQEACTTSGIASIDRQPECISFGLDCIFTLIPLYITLRWLKNFN